MSYILEALKKAQAERQLGSAPTLHAQPVHPAGTGGGAHRTPWPIAPGVLVLGAMTLLAAGAALFMWTQRAPAVAPAALPAVPSAALPAVPSAALSAVPAAMLPAAPSVAAPSAPAVTRAPAVRAVAPAPVAVLALPTPASVAAPVMTAPPPTPVRALPTPIAGAVPVPAPASEEDVPAARDLPEAIRRELPQVVFGGYIYSPNRADRLLLVDKVLRHEGEEVAPGLMLEALRPKSAVLSYRGYRYRLPY